MTSSVQDQEGCRPVSIGSGVLTRSLWWLAGGVSLNCRGRSGPGQARREEVVTTPDQIRNMEQVRQVVLGLVALQMPPRKDDALRYRWIDASLHTLQYRELTRSDRGTVLQYLKLLTGYSRAQVNRLVARWTAGQTLAKLHSRPGHAFSRRYQAAEILQLAQVDAELGRLSGAATLAVLRRHSSMVAGSQWATLASISVSQLYRLRQSPEYVAAMLPGQDLVPRCRATVGVRSGPQPTPCPGMLRVESVSPGRTPTTRRVCIVDAATRWRVLIDWPAGGADEGTSKLALAALVRQLPFTIREIAPLEGADEHCHQVASHLEAGWAGGLAPRQDFELDPWSRFVNLHRPCVFAPGRGDQQVGVRQVVMTPLERLLSHAAVEGVLRSGVSVTRLQVQADTLDPLTAASLARAFMASAGALPSGSRMLED